MDEKKALLKALWHEGKSSIDLLGTASDLALGISQTVMIWVGGGNLGR